MNMKRLQRWLDENDLTQRELADRCEVSAGLISQYINGTTEPSIDTLKTLSVVTGLTTDALLFGDEDESGQVAVVSTRKAKTARAANARSAR